MFAAFYVELGFLSECQIYFGTPSLVLANLLCVNELNAGNMYWASEEDQEKVYELQEDLYNDIIKPEYVKTFKLELEEGDITSLGYAYTKDQLTDLKETVLKCKRQHPNSIRQSEAQLNCIFDCLSSRCDPALYGAGDEEYFEYQCVSPSDPEYMKTLRMCDGLVHLG